MTVMQMWCINDMKVWSLCTRLYSANLINEDEMDSACSMNTTLKTYAWGRRWRSWLRHCTTSRKVAGSIPDGVTGIFH